MRFTDEKKVVTNRPTDGPTDRPRDAWTHLKTLISDAITKPCWMRNEDGKVTTEQRNKMKDQENHENIRN